MVSLSVCVFSDRSPERLAAIVAPFSGVANEIVVALDDCDPDPDLAPLREVGAETIMAPFQWPLETNLTWLHAQCSGDWILRLDGDEVPSRALVELLAGDDWHRDVTHCWVPRRWLVDEGASWIEANPWWPDLQLRLVANHPELVRFSHGVHEPIEVAGAGRPLPAPIYHLDLIDVGLETRRAKSHRYYRARPELRTFGGLAMGAYYTPELITPSPPLAPVPTEDQALVGAALAKDRHLVDSGAPQPRTVRPGPRPGQSVALDVEHVDRSGYAGRGVEMLVMATNTGTQPLDPFADHPFRVGCRWRDSVGRETPEQGRAHLPGPLQPGRSEWVQLATTIPSPAGEYTLSIAAVEEEKRWFSDAVKIEFTVLDQPHLTLVGGYSPFRHLGDDLIIRSSIEDLTDEFPQLCLTLLADDPAAISERFGVAARPGAAEIHHLNLTQGYLGADSVDRALSASHLPPAGEGAGDDLLANLTDVIGRSQVLVIAAAGSLTSAYADAVLWPRLIEAEIAAAAGVPVLITSAGMGPFTADDHRDAARRLLDIASEVRVRDELSRRTVSELIGDKATTITDPDAASWLRGAPDADLTEFLAENGIRRRDPYLVASVRADDDLRTVGQVARCIEVAAHILDAVVILVPHCASPRVDDRPALVQLAGLLNSELKVVSLTDIPPDPLAADLIRNASVSVGSRFHNAVLSASAGHPAILFHETAYDEQRALGLAAQQGSAVSVMDGSEEHVAHRTRQALSRPALRPRYRQARPLVSAVQWLGIMGRP